MPLPVASLTDPYTGSLAVALAPGDGLETALLEGGEFGPVSAAL
ncbi:hypothetical protein [Natrinema zhouii]|nr:hypothetical protein [Natrinema zhouii]